jgi:hypothetical protein
LTQILFIIQSNDKQLKQIQKAHYFFQKATFFLLFSHTITKHILPTSK